MTKLHKKFFLSALCVVLSLSAFANRLTVGNTNASYANLDQAVNAAASGDTLYLTSNVNIESHISIARNLTIMSDGGYSIVKNKENGSYESVGITVNGGYTLTLLNVTLDANNKKSNSQNVYSHFVNVNSDATLVMDYKSAIINSSDGAVLNVAGTVIGGKVMNNTSDRELVGVVYLTSSGKLVNMLLTGNSVSSTNVPLVKMSGGTLINCTITDNFQGTHRTRYAIDASGDGCKIQNCIIYNNANSDKCFMNPNTGKPSVYNSCVKGEVAKNDRNGNIDKDPGFNADYSLPKGSPCINKGKNSYLDDEITTDIEGNRRIRETSVDMGAFEYQPEYVKRPDVHVSCGQPFVWIDGVTYTESTTDPRDTLFGGVNSDTIMMLDLTVYQPMDISSLQLSDKEKKGCAGSSVTFSFEPKESDRTSYKWVDENGSLLGTGTSYELVVPNEEQHYYFVSSVKNGLCPDSVLFTIKPTTHLVVNIATDSITLVADNSCLYSQLDLSTLLPSVDYCSAYTSISYYYQVNDGEWMDVSLNPTLTDIQNQTHIRWKARVYSSEDEYVEEVSESELILYVVDESAPVWDLEHIVRINYLDVQDSVNGIVSFQPTVVATDNCTGEITLYVSENETDYTLYTPHPYDLNVFSDTSKVLWWKAADQNGNMSDVLSVTYSIRKGTEVNGNWYSIVRDTFICANEFPFEWHGHTFAQNGESAEVMAAYLTVYADSSFYQTDSVVSSKPYVWRDGYTYTNDTIVKDFHVANLNDCDSVFTLVYVRNLSDTTVCMGELPIVWHGEEFTYDGQSIVIEGDPFTIHVDSSFYKEENIMQKAPYVWRDGVVYLRDTIVREYHVANASGCDSVYTLIYVNNADTVAPILVCDNLFQNDRVKPLVDSINGVVTTQLDLSSVLNNASDDHSTNLLAYISEDGDIWREFVSQDYSLNAYTNPEKTFWWKVVDEAENESEVCPVTFAIERSTEKDGVLYSIVRDTIVCAGDMPFEWHGHSFVTSGESAVVGAAHLTLYVDSSFFKVEKMLSQEPIVWRDGKTYSEDTTVVEYHVPNIGTCDSVFTLIFIMGRDSVAPVLNCDNISLNKRIQPVSDSISGRVEFTVLPSDVLSAASDNYSEELSLYVSEDGTSFVTAENLDFQLNVYTQEAKTLWWKVADESGNESAVCPTTYSIERASEKNGELYAVVRDSMICVDDSNIEWHGHTFESGNQSAVVGAAYLTLQYDSSYVRMDTLVVCADTFRWRNNIKYRGGSSYDIVYRLDNGEGKCDSIINMHLTIHSNVKNSKDTVYYTGCKNMESYTFGYGSSSLGTHTVIQWYENDTLRTWTERQRNMPLSGYDNYIYTYIVNTPDGYCPDTTVYVTNSVHHIELVDGGEKDLIFEAGEGCKARIRLRDFMPEFDDHCSNEFVDTICEYNINNAGFKKALRDDYYEFEDGDSIVWSVGILASDGGEYSVTNGSTMHQVVTVIDRKAPEVDELGISYQNRKHKVTASDGKVSFNVPLTDVTDHISDNCDATEDLLIQYGNDKSSMQKFEGATFQLDAFEQPTLLIYYSATDTKGNQMIDSVLYEVSRDIHIGEDSFAMSIDTILCPQDFPYRWHNVEFTHSGESASKGAVYMTVFVDSSLFKVETVIACDSFVWRDGVTYTENTTSAVYYVNNGEGECDSIITLHLTLLNSAIQYDSVSVCESELPYTWNGFEMMKDTIIHYTNSMGCDSAVGLKLTVLPTIMTTIEDTACVTYSWNGEVYSTSGVYQQKFTSQVTGCDSIVELHLIVSQPSRDTVIMNVCEKQLPYRWNGLDALGDTTVTLQNRFGCDSIVHLSLSILPVITETLYDTACVSYVLNGETYTASGVYEQRFVSEATGCDSLLILNLLISQPVSVEDSIAICPSQLPYSWNGMEVMGDTVVTLVGPNGCDSIVTLKVNRLEPTYGSESITVCPSQLPYLWNGFEMMNDTTILLNSVGGCDSIVDLKLTVLPYIVEDLYDTACGSYTINGETYTTSGVYEQKLTSVVSGCDSILNIHLTIHQPTESIENIQICPSQLPYLWEGNRIEGDTILTIQNVAGCDSVVTFKFELLPEAAEHLYDTACVRYMLNGVSYTQSGEYKQNFTSHTTGCDSVLYLHLTILQPTYAEDSIYACSQMLPVKWNDIDIYRDTIVTIQNSMGCDSFVTIKVLPIPSVRSELYDTACTVYSLNGLVYRQSGVYEQKLTSLVTGCDSILQLHLTILQPSKKTDTVSVCIQQLPYEWNGFAMTHDTTITLENHLGCDSIVTLKMNLVPVVRETVYDTACGSLTYNGVTYTETGVYEQQLTSSVTGCDSILQLHLTIHQPVYLKDTISLCRDQLPYVWHGYEIDRDTLLSTAGENGCDTIVAFTMNILPVQIENIYAVACERYILNDFSYTETGIYDQRFVSKVTGCDSIIRLNLTILTPTSGYEKINICANELPYKWEGHEIVGDTVLVIPNMKGCDSTVTLNLNIHPIHTTVLYDTTCGIYSLNGTLYSESGIYKQQLTSQVTGCDSIVELHLVVNTPTHSEDTLVICDNDEFATWNGHQVYGDTILTIVNSAGCDSVVSIHLIKNPSSHIELEEVTCGSYEWNDSTYTVSGDYQQSFVNRWGCDSIVTLHLTVSEPKRSSFADTAIAFYEWNEELYEESGTYTQTLSTVYGCDSIVTLDLVILPTSASVDTLRFTVCENDLPYEWNGNLLKREKSIFNFKNELGQDSMVVVMLNILNTVHSEDSVEACSSYNWHGKIFRKSGIYSDTLTSQLGCDSICDLNLTIYGRTETTVDLVSCRQDLPLHWNGFEIDSDTSVVMTSIHGCDSIINVNLTIYENAIADREYVSTCGGEYIWRGKSLIGGGVFYDTLSTVYGCDSILSISITVNPVGLVTLYDTVVMGTRYQKNGFDVEPAVLGDNDYDLQLTSVSGCDSVVRLHLYARGRDVDFEILSISGGTTLYKGDKIIGSRFCSSDEFVVNYKVTEGIVSSYAVMFDKKGMEQGFETYEGDIVEDEGSLTIPMPTTAAPGKYTVYVQFFGEEGKSKMVMTSLTVGMDSQYVKNVYGNVIYCEDSDNKFTSYQWYKDGYEINGANDPSYKDVSGKGGVYSLMVTMKDGEESYICGKQHGLLPVPFSIWAASAYADGGHATIYVEGVSEKDLEGAHLYVYTLNGVIMYQTSTVQIQNDFRIPQGCYVCQVVLANEETAVCQIVSYGKVFGFIGR
ncbi:MAG: hypothetical protein MJZ34_00355 [Paludibacteraceae bacterium]|nr:hypothetical protein [Paludibacteraceae bacterium]